MTRLSSLGIEIELPVYRSSIPRVLSFFKYTKAKPMKYHGHLFSKDASMLELAIAPASSPEEFDRLYQQAYDKAMSLLPDGMELRHVPTVEYTDAELEADPYASVLGCAPSHTIYGTTPTPDVYPDNKRYGGVHLNIEVDKYDAPVEDMVLALDYTVGLHSVLNWECDYHAELRDRRRVYGRAGEYRVKSFGFEYRPLPNCIQTSGAELWSLVNQALCLDATTLYPVAHTVQEAINNSDADLARTILEDI